jgi:hypothetical protein
VENCPNSLSCNTLPTFEPPLDQGLLATIRNSRIHVIFLKVYLDNNISHADSACFPKFDRRKRPAFEHIIDQRASRAGGRVMETVPEISKKVITLCWVLNSIVSKILRAAQNF